ncbi:MAG: ATP-binding cassette domain-containing protein [Leptolyngbya sp. IPPAS B-1204]
MNRPPFDSPMLNFNAKPMHVYSTQPQSLRPDLPTAPVLTANGLWKSYGKHTVVQDVSFTLHPGEVLGLLGPNGAGKTTTVEMLYGAVKPSRGYVQIGDAQVHLQPKRARSCLGVVTQEDNLDLEFRVLQNLIHFAHHYRIVGQAARQRAGEVLAQVNLENHANYRISQLSGGMKRRLVLARALLNQPQVIFLDEPTTGLDPDARQDFWKVVTDLKQQGCGIVLTTHYMDEAYRLCDRLLLLQQGQIIDQGTPDELIERTIGQEVIEIEGIPEPILQELLAHTNAWLRPFGSGYLLSLPNPADADEIWSRLAATHPRRLTRRAANLEDVFLRLTGSALS